MREKLLKAIEEKRKKISNQIAQLNKVYLVSKWTTYRDYSSDYHGIWGIFLEERVADQAVWWLYYYENDGEYHVEDQSVM